jgi:spermidine/putrescine transport system ATP-binding protein
MNNEAEFAVVINEVSKAFDDQLAVDSVSLSIREGEFFSLLGPSGCGKTTLLRIIAGLEASDTGTVSLVGRLQSDIPAHKRPVNTIFQSYALFPHLTVAKNVAFGLRMKKLPVATISGRVERALEQMQLTAWRNRYPAQLSGGQRQRVAIARAIVNEPRILLLDEPLAALDKKLREEVQQELRSLQRALNITFICVTHDQEEAFALSDRIAVMRAGKIEQVGTPRELYDTPANLFVSSFVGTTNKANGTVIEVNAGEVVVDSPWGRIRADRRNGPSTAKHGDSVVLTVRPESLNPSTPGSAPAENQVKSLCKDIVFHGSSVFIDADVSGALLVAELDPDDFERSSATVGRELTLGFDADEVRFFESRG